MTKECSGVQARAFPGSWSSKPVDRRRKFRSWRGVCSTASWRPRCATWGLHQPRTSYGVPRESGMEP